MGWFCRKITIAVNLRIARASMSYGLSFAAYATLKTCNLYLFIAVFASYNYKGTV